MVIFIGSLLLGIGINGFLVPYHLIDGGIIGIALIIHYYFHLPVGLLMVILSTPLGIYTWLREPAYFYNSVIGLFVSALFIDWLAPLKEQLQIPILVSALLGGILIGLGTGLMLRYKTSTGGTDLLAQFVAKALSLNIGIVIFLIDGLIVTAGLSFLGMITFIFSSLTILTVGVTSSLIIGRPDMRFKA
ncbi:YitT family protein [Bacillus benzoevorans]|uniref:Uncharacterized membrane-anchored protein YitT (DUF2179 family) n=1 Tax=Bacillus benzoevorans TaxID=1456 RepID=A0A7X0HTS7_9BACI|nr:YitT family protein [Bacillus benzoevorans]MBB6446688.1 uncharacterized membrane-anchored protein YitT (DUF2179 family) [Bacillus benzoevorans]